MPGKGHAAVKIQKAYRGYVARRRGLHRHTHYKRRMKSSAPRYRIQQNPLYKPTCYNFTRSYDYAVTVGNADNDNLVFMNSDNKYMIIKLHGIMSNLPSFDDFRTLFNQFQLVSIKHTLTPNFRNNIGQSVAYDSNDNVLFTQAVPNYQVFFIPENYTIDKPDLQTLSATEIDEFVNKSQRKAVALIPNKAMIINNKRPSIPGDVIAQEKGQGFVSSDMVRAGYLDNDLQDTVHYGYQLVIRKVDGTLISSHNPSSTIATSPMGWRIDNQLFFRCRKVQ
jgi:hypothetical protein